jgi:predicted nucleotidyltransferase
MVKLVAHRLDKLRDKVVFLGGAVTDFLITDPAAPSVRPTKDVDIIVEVASRRDYYDLRDHLVELGFKEDPEEGAPLCRWKIDDVTVDIMPTQGEILGFSNKWHKAAVQTAVTTEVAEGLSILLVTAPCFLATKLEAFTNRGREDFMGSHDLEDVITILDGRPEVIDEIGRSPQDVKDFLVEAFRALLKKQEFQEALQGHLPPDRASQERVPILVERIRKIVDLQERKSK